MDRASLEELLEEGLSLAEIGRRFGLHESTVGYSVQRHGLEPVNRKRCAARGALTRAQLAPLVEAGLSIAQIAVQVDRSKATVRHWLREFGLSTRRAQRRRIPADGGQVVVLDCAHHGATQHSRRSKGGYRCNRCRAEAVTRRRRKVKRLLVQEAGGSCMLCGYSRYIGALEFHHLVPAEKRFSLSHRGVTRSLAAAREEADRCVLVCANCHAEVEAGISSIPCERPVRVQ